MTLNQSVLAVTLNIQDFFPQFPSTHFPHVRPFISAPTGFHDQCLVNRWAQLLITSNYDLPRTPKDQSTRRAELSCRI